MFELRELCNKRGISHGGNKKKDEMIQDLLKPVQYVTKNDTNYNEMTCPELKRLAKERQLLRYNNLSKSSLVELHEKYDEELEKQQEKQIEQMANKSNSIETKEFSLIDTKGCVHPIIIRKDGMANATMLAKAYNKEVKYYLRNESAKVYIEALQEELNCSYEELVNVKYGGDSKLVGTWVHHLIAIDMARWAYPPAAIQMDKWIKEYIITGTIQQRRPCNINFDLTNMDIEAEELESQLDIVKHSNVCSLYIAYIGDGRVKIGVSDCRLLKREYKHSSTESQFLQFRFIETFQISSTCIEKLIHELLQRYRVVYNKQKEIYKPPNTLKEFVQQIGSLLKEHDLKMEIIRLQNVINNLELQNKTLERDNYRLQLDLNKYAEIH